MRHRFLTLDGLRGYAAVCVVLFHLHTQLGLGGWMEHGYLAVDFFFLLSGFVIAHAYEERLRQPGSFRPFLRDRVIRLHPLLLLSIVPGLLATAAQIALGKPTVPYPLLTVLAAPIPFPAFWIPPATDLAFPLNVPSWSLFWELAINIAFALAAPRLSTRVLVAVAVAGTLGAIAMSLGSGGIQRTDYGAALRVLPAFTMGVLLLRVHSSGKLRLAPIGVAGAPLLLLTLALPRFSDAFSAAYDPLVAYGLYPLILLACASRQSRFTAIDAFLGEMSYPLYVLHHPLLAYPASTIRKFVHAPVPATLVEMALCFVVTLLAWRFYDRPVRAALRRRLGSSGHRRPSE